MSGWHQFLTGKSTTDAFLFRSYTEMTPGAATVPVRVLYAAMLSGDAFAAY
jgi:hypothetical protein